MHRGMVPINMTTQQTGRARLTRLHGFAPERGPRGTRDRSGQYQLELLHLPPPTGPAAAQAKMLLLLLLLPVDASHASCAAPVKAKSTESASAAGGRLGVDRRRLEALEKAIVAQNKLPQASASER